MAKKLTYDKRTALYARYMAAYTSGVSVADSLVNDLRAMHGYDSPEYNYVKSLDYLMRVCPVGTEVAAIQVSSRMDACGNSSRCYRVLAPYIHTDGAHGIAELTPHLIEVGIGERARRADTIALRTNGYAADIAQRLGHFLHGDTHTISHRTI